MGLFVNFACHLTIGNGPGFSADYVYLPPGSRSGGTTRIPTSPSASCSGRRGT